MVTIYSPPEQDKLNSENCSAWEIKMRSILIAINVWKIVNGTTQTLVNFDVIRSMKGKERIAIATITLLVVDYILTHIVKVTTSNEAWGVLRKRYSGNTSKEEENKEEITLVAASKNAPLDQ